MTLTFSCVTLKWYHELHGSLETCRLNLNFTSIVELQVDTNKQQLVDLMTLTLNIFNLAILCI